MAVTRLPDIGRKLVVCWPMFGFLETMVGGAFEWHCGQARSSTNSDWIARALTSEKSGKRRCPVLSQNAWRESSRTTRARQFGRLLSACRPAPLATLFQPPRAGTRGRIHSCLTLLAISLSHVTVRASALQMWRLNRI